jgi:hypothetical protein
VRERGYTVCRGVDGAIGTSRFHRWQPDADRRLSVARDRIDGDVVRMAGHNARVQGPTLPMMLLVVVAAGVNFR